MTIVVGFVPKPSGLAALRVAVEEARIRGERLYVLNTSRGAPLDSGYAAADELAEARRLLDASGVDYELDRHVSQRDADEDVLEAAAREQASMIVIGLRRRSPTGKLLFGSTAQRILLDAECPVLAVKAGPQPS